MTSRYGDRLRSWIAREKPVPVIGIYDAFSASIVGRRFEGLFVSGFGFAASFYGLPDIGLISWSEIVAFVQRLRILLPRHHLLVDIDDGYGDPEVACHVVSLLEAAGASGVVLEDQRRPRRCGHLDGKQLLDLPEFLEKLRKVLATRRNLFVVARTDAPEPEESIRRAQSFADCGADAVLVDAIGDLSELRRLARLVDRPIGFNQMAGGKSPRCGLTELRGAGVSLVLYSTPCLFAAQGALVAAVESLERADGLLPRGGVELATCNALLMDNLAGRDQDPDLQKETP